MDGLNLGQWRRDPISLVGSNFAGGIGPADFNKLGVTRRFRMQRVFQSFVDGLVASDNAESLRAVLADAGAALDLSCFAYLSMPLSVGDAPTLISTYPVKWTDRYLRERYERIDPVIVDALATPEPFEWGQEFPAKRLSKLQCSLLDEAAQFGIRCGFTVPIHDARGTIAAVTFAADQRRPKFRHCIEQHRHVLQLMAMYFHAHARRRLSGNRVIDGIVLSPRELECLEWAARGKSAWEIGRLLNISRRTAAFHLDNAKAKFGVRTICQAVAKLAAAKSTTE
ncbi:autoinducer-binding domain-containing protein [Hyphomicrobium denitrificans 1NES1]|uniref:Autoinducer-binding domain-containing protein n=2 Tax=Hyphomicrobium denitrificans TaxID=53399 RepID=N0B4K5_9HYPH|nr:autoinducer-binding domain-containing protein [Hyphomicrobium denitrificans 1NES1]